MSARGGSGTAHGDNRLDARSFAVLRALIQEHIASGEPIASKTVCRRAPLKLSPATVRGIMALLEERGFLMQPHTSAGRVPTDRAYRFYVDRMIARRRVDETQARAIDTALRRSGGEIEDLLGEASRQLSHFSHQVGLVLAPDLGRVLVDHLEFVRLDARRVVAILVSRSGVVHHRILEGVAEPREPSELERIGRFLSAELGGRTLPEMRRILRKRLSEERAAYDRWVAQSLDLGDRALEAGDSAAEVFVEGTSNLVDAPEFTDSETMRGLLRTLEERKSLIDLLGRVLEGRGVQVVIGEENPSRLSRCSLVAATYGVPGRALGTLGIVGPTRMEYARAIALVDFLAGVLTRRLTPWN